MKEKLQLLKNTVVDLNDRIAIAEEKFREEERAKNNC